MGNTHWSKAQVQCVYARSRQPSYCFQALELYLSSILSKICMWMILSLHLLHKHVYQSFCCWNSVNEHICCSGCLLDNLFIQLILWVHYLLMLLIGYPIAPELIIPWCLIDGPWQIFAGTRFLLSSLALKLLLTRFCSHVRELPLEFGGCCQINCLHDYVWPMSHWLYTGTFLMERKYPIGIWE